MALPPRWRLFCVEEHTMKVSQSGGPHDQPVPSSTRLVGRSYGPRLWQSPRGQSAPASSRRPAAVPASPPQRRSLGGTSDHRPMACAMGLFCLLTAMSAQADVLEQRVIMTRIPGTRRTGWRSGTASKAVMAPSPATPAPKVRCGLKRESAVRTEPAHRCERREMDQALRRCCNR